MHMGPTWLSHTKIHMTTQFRYSVEIVLGTSFQIFLCKIWALVCLWQTRQLQKKVLKSLHTTIDDAIDSAGLPLLGVIPEDSDLGCALNRGVALRERNYYAARAYENIAKRIAGCKVPLMKI